MIPFLDLHIINAGFERGFQNKNQKFTDLKCYILDNEVVSVLNSY